MENEVCEQCRPLFKQMEKRIKEPEHRLLAYENAHTPPSRLRWQPHQPPSEPKKRGAPEGHPGTTQPKPEPTITLTFNENFAAISKFFLPRQEIF